MYKRFVAYTVDKNKSYLFQQNVSALCSLYGVECTINLYNISLFWFTIQVTFTIALTSETSEEILNFVEDEIKSKL